MSKKCSKCALELDDNLFHKRLASKDGLQSTCKSCSSRKSKEPKKNAYLSKSDRKKNYDIKYRYKISIEEYNGMLARQDNRCCICLEVPFGTGTMNKFHIDHCHSSSSIRGLLCGRCNTALGLLKEDRNVMLRMVDYIDSHKPTQHGESN